MEGVRIEVIRGINAAIGVAIFVPGATNLIVSLNNGERNASSLQLRRHSQSRHPGTDNEHLEVCTPRRI